MEYLTNRPESNMFSRFIPMFFLLFLLLRSFGLHANIRGEPHYPKEIEPRTYVDRKPFNERIWWIDHSEQDGKIICSQRVGVFSEFYEEAPIDCTLGRRISAAQKAQLSGVDKNAKCLSDGHTILCENPDRTVMKFDAQEPPQEPQEEETYKPRSRVRFVGQR